MQVEESVLSRSCTWVLRNREGEKLILRVLPGKDCTVGRGPESDLPIQDAGISRRHARFFMVGNELWIEDLESQNGTFLNGERVEKAAVRPGDILFLGRIPLMLQELELPAGAGAPGCSRILRNLPQERLAFLLQAALRLADAGEGASLFQLTLDMAVEGLRAERGAVMAPERGKYGAVAIFPHEGFHDLETLAGSRECEAVFRGGAARLLPCGPSRPGDPALEARRGRSGIAAPLAGREGTLGVIFIECAAGPRRYGEGDADFLLALAGLAARSLEQARRLAEARSAVEEHQRRSHRRECDLEKARADLRDLERRACLDIYPEGLGRLAAEAREIASILQGIDRQLPAGVLAASARLEGLAEGLSLLAGPPAKAPEGAAPSRTVVRKLVEEAISKLPFTARGRLRWTRTDPSIDIETRRPEALRWLLGRIIGAAVDEEPPREGSAVPSGSGRDVFLHLWKDGEEVVFLCEAPSGQGPESPSARQLSPFEKSLAQRVARDVLGGEFILSGDGPTRVISLRAPARPPVKATPDETVVLRPKA